MDIEARKKQVLDRNWEKYVPTAPLPRRTDRKKQVGEVWAYNNSESRGVVLVVDSDGAIVLAGGDRGRGSRTGFSVGGGRLEQGILVEGVEADWRVGWEVEPDQPKGDGADAFPVGSRWLVGARGMDVRSESDSRLCGEVLEVVGTREVNTLLRIDVVSADGRRTNHGTGMIELSKRMRPAPGATAGPAGPACGDLHTGYGLKCTMDREHEGDRHENARSGARWPVRRVVRLKGCVTGFGHPGPTPAAVATILLEGETVDACEPCALAHEARIAVMTRQLDERRPQPRYTPPSVVQSHATLAGGVFGIGVR